MVFFCVFSYNVAMRKTKIVATLGPKSESVEVLAELLKAGMDVARLNFSHDDFAVHQRQLDNLREASLKTSLPVLVMQDLGGPKIRIGDFATGKVALIAGQTLTLSTEQIVGDVSRVSVNYPLLPQEVKTGQIIFLNDGNEKLRVTEIKGSDVVCEILVGGEISGHRGLNLPGAELSIKTLTEKDLVDLEFGFVNRLDFVALSFVRSPSDISDLRRALSDRGNIGNTQTEPQPRQEQSMHQTQPQPWNPQIVAKIETPQAIAHIDDIIRLSDVLMVARGDLAIETSFEEVPIDQKVITEKCNRAGKPTIVATQMLESMVASPTPTRAEVSDVANAVLDGADMLMLSEETATGQNPAIAVAEMARIIEEVEGDAKVGVHSVAD